MTAAAPDFSCSVTGTPAPQGSKRHVGHGVMVEMSQQLPDWRTAVALQVRSEMRKTGHPGYGHHVPVSLRITFYLRRPATLPRRVTQHVRKPDLDKLARSTLDSLKICGLLADDAQVCVLAVGKVYAAAGFDTGCAILATELGAE